MSKKRLSTLDNFLTKKIKTTNDKDKNENALAAHTENSVTHEADLSGPCASSTTSLTHDKTEVEQDMFTYVDIGKFSGSSISDANKYKILSCKWFPKQHYKFPFSEHTKKGNNVRCYLSENI